MATYVNDLRLKEIATGDEAGTWGTSTNTNLELIAEAFSFGTEAISTNADTHTTTIADGATDPGRSIFLKYTGTLDSTCTITIGPNTVSKLWIIENGTSGSQSIIIKQGSGATVTIPSGKTKVVYSDGGSSGAAIVDAFASLNLETSGIIETSSSIQTPLIEFTDGDDAIAISDGGAVSMASTLGVTGILTCTDDIIIGDGKTIGSASDVDAMTIASNGQVTFSQTLIGTALDISGDIDVDGTTNLDVVDIDGAVDMASTLAVGDVVTANAGITSGNIAITTTGSSQISLLDSDNGFAASTINVENGGRDLKLTTPQDTIFVQGSTEAIRILDGGNVGIGTSSPSATLHVNSGTNDVGAIFESTDQKVLLALDDSLKITTIESNNGILKFGTNGASGGTSATEAMRIDRSGNVGIGTSPAQTLDVSGSVQFGDGGSAVALNFNATGNAQLKLNGTERMRIDSSGNLLVGSTTDHEGKVQIAATNESGLFVRDSSASSSAPYVRVQGQRSDTNTSEAFSGGLVLEGYHTSDKVPDSKALGTIYFGGNHTNGTESNISYAASIVGKAEGAFNSATDMPTGLAFFTGDAGTALKTANSDFGTERMRIDHDGKVGIGTASPDADLHISSAGGTELHLQEETSGQAAQIKFTNTQNSFAVGADANPQIFFINTSDNQGSGIVMDTSHNVGIGTSSPSHNLHVFANSGTTQGITSQVNNANAANFQFEKSRGGSSGPSVVQSGDDLGNLVFAGYDGNSYASAATIKGEVDGTPGDGDMPGRLSFRTSADGSESPSERMRIDSSGNVGIGTTSPSQILQLKADTPFIQFNQTGTDSFAGLNFGDDDDANDGQILYDHDSRYMRFQVANNERVRINSSGNVGIGTTSPSEPLHVNEGTGGVSTTLLLQNSSASVDGRGTNLTFKSSSTEIGQIQSKTSSDATSGILAFKTASSGTLSEQMRIDKDGNVVINRTSKIGTNILTLSYDSGSSEKGMAINTTGSGSATHMTFLTGANAKGSISTDGSSVAYNTSSDARLKDVTGSARGLEVINELNPVAYNWKADGKADEGLIAQEVLDVVPNSVNQNEDGYYQMDYSKLVTHLVKGMQEQQEQIESLKSEIANLTGE